MNIQTVFDSQDQAKKRAALKGALNKLDLLTTFRLRYEIGGRRGYTVGTLEDVLFMITFVNDAQKDTFLTILREELDKPVCLGHTGPVGSCDICAASIVYGPTGTHSS